MSTIRKSLDSIINLVDYTRHQCGLAAPIGAAVAQEYFEDARAALESDRAPSELRTALLVLLDQIDFTHGACGPFDMVGACLPTCVIDRVRIALES